ncbi:hypothetical protein [Pontivivens ytuae]|uniref:Phosphomannomutase n=1 Tax=Pontivivens ytuae TaxID=2789856 RepID=A0A7S9LUD4_9RHOB|nr:hypothetical protein [Pontivivens ytuae]QPH55424.1 hypothetical protein I0K15_06730 [Pontivivens ytuae]
MFTIEHEFDATVVTLIDEAEAVEDVTITVFDDGARVEQLDERTGKVQTVVLSTAQLRDLRAALDLPEGTYRLRRVKD